MNQLHSASDAIKQAIEAGWDLNEALEIPTNLGFFPELDHVELASKLYLEKVLCLPSFWQALSKARQWDRVHEDFCYARRIGGKCDCHPDVEWEFRAKQWFDHRLYSGDEVRFWELLP